MKAIIVNPKQIDSVRLADIDKPVPSDKQVLMETLCVGIDGTDREINEGIYGEAPVDSEFLVLGHEAVAKVNDFGTAVEGFEKGDLVVPMVRRPCWENYNNCKFGEVDMCLTGDYLEHGIIKLHGFASKYAVSDADFLVKLPAELEEVGVLLEPLSVAEKAISQVYKIQQRMFWKPKTAFVLGAGPLGLLATMVLRLKGFEVYCAATRSEESLKADIVRTVGATYVNTTETPFNGIPTKFDLIIEATGNVKVAIESLYLLDSNGVLCFLGIYRDKMACEDFGKALTKMVLGNRLIFGSVSSNRSHFQAGIQHMLKIQQKYRGVLNKMLTSKLELSNFRKAFFPNRNEIKTVICFK